MKVLIIGLGSIATKHIMALRSIQPGIELVALRSGFKTHTMEGVTDIDTWEDLPSDLDFIIISNPTGEHYKTIMRASETGLPLFIEKPPLANLVCIDDLLRILKQNGNTTYVAFVLRFHPVTQWLKKNLEISEVTEVQSYCGSYLPEWRNGSDYRTTYSGQSKMGGGVHLDLIHEIDYLRWIFGDPVSYHAFLSKKSPLEIDTFDSAHYYLEYDRLNVSVTLNYFRRDSKRIMEIVMNEETLVADFLSYKIKTSTGNTLFECEPDNMKMYEDQMRYFVNSIRHNVNPESNIEYSLKTLIIALGK